MGCFSFLGRAARIAALSTGIAGFAAAVTVNNPIMYVDSPDLWATFCSSESFYLSQVGFQTIY